MRALKISIGAAVVIALCGYIYFFLFVPYAWRADTRKASIEVLSKSQSHEQLEEAVKPYGVLVYAKDGSWVAIRYRDTHYTSPIQALAIGKDSGGRWYSCDRHFCGWLTAFARERARGLSPDLLKDGFPMTGGRKGQVGYDRMEALFSAADLKSLRDALMQMDFQEFTPN
jgi:hypothetical protein